MKRLIVNADDFGMTSGINRAIVESYRHGIVTSTTLMAAGGAFEEAVELARETPGLAVGCHVSLVQARALLPATSIPNLVSDGRNRNRYRGLPDFGRAAWLGRVPAEEIANEARAQFQKLQAAGIEISHFDTHKHVHLVPAVLNPLLKAAQESGIRAVRCPFELRGSVPPFELWRRRRLWKRAPVLAVLRRLEPRFRRLCAVYGLATADGAIGISATGCLDENLLKGTLQRLPEGNWELVCHPAYLDDQLRELSTLRTGETELAALTSAGVRELLGRCGIELSTYAALFSANNHRLVSK